MLKDLGNKPEESFYAHSLKDKVEKMLSLWASNLDPLKYRKLYVKKVNLDTAPVLNQNKFGDRETTSGSVGGGSIVFAR